MRAFSHRVVITSYSIHYTKLYEAIRAQIEAWLARPEIEIILTTGGTGFSPRDNTPEAVKPLLRREMDGFAAAFHAKSLQSVGVATMQSRAFAGQAGDAFIFCVPGSTGACRDAWDGLLELECDSRHKPCVITSYSIHYTKLYDRVKRGAGSPL